MIFLFLLQKLCQGGLFVKRDADEFAITHAKLLQNDFDVALLMHGNGVGLLIPFEMNFEEEMQLGEVIHLEFTLEARLQLVDHVHTACQNDEVVYIYDYNHNVITSL